MKSPLILFSGLLSLAATAELSKAPGEIRVYNLDVTHHLKQVALSPRTNNADQMMPLPAKDFPGTVVNPRIKIQASRVEVEGKTVKIFGAYAEFQADFWKYSANKGSFAGLQVDCENFVGRMIFGNPLSVELPEEITVKGSASNGKLSASLDFDVENWARGVVAPYFTAENLEKNFGIDASRCSGSNGNNKNALLNIMAANLRKALTNLHEKDKAGFSREVKTLVPHLNEAIEKALAKENIILQPALKAELIATLKYENGAWMLKPKAAQSMDQVLSPMGRSLLAKNRERHVQPEQAVVVEAVLSHQIMTETMSLLLENLVESNAKKVQLFSESPQAAQIKSMPEIGAAPGELSVTMSGMTCAEQRALQFIQPWTLTTQGGALRQGIDVSGPVRVNIYRKGTSEVVAQRWAMVDAIVEITNLPTTISLNLRDISLKAQNQNELCGVKAMGAEDAAYLSSLSLSEDYMDQSNKELSKSFKPQGPAEFNIAVLLPGEIPQAGAQSKFGAVAQALKAEFQRKRLAPDERAEDIVFNTYGEGLVLYVKKAKLNNSAPATVKR
jgi:hypothetical protein